MFQHHTYDQPPAVHSFPTRRSSDLSPNRRGQPTRSCPFGPTLDQRGHPRTQPRRRVPLEDLCTQLEQRSRRERSEEHTSELQSPCNLVCRLLLEKKKI